jgi:hypothetical protein
MFRFLRIGLLGLVCAVPFALPQASDAAPAAPNGIVRCRPMTVRHTVIHRHGFGCWHRFHR